eukprot:EG_transcript_34116
MSRVISTGGHSASARAPAAKPAGTLTPATKRTETSSSHTTQRAASKPTPQSALAKPGASRSAVTRTAPARPTPQAAFHPVPGQRVGAKGRAAAAAAAEARQAVAQADSAPP